MPSEDTSPPKPEIWGTGLFRSRTLVAIKAGSKKKKALTKRPSMKSRTRRKPSLP